MSSKYWRISSRYVIIHIGHDRPALKFLYKYVCNEVTSMWHELGLELLEPEDEEGLNEIKSNNPHDVRKCCKEMFHLWLSRHPFATWNQLIQALKELNLNKLAATIKRMLSDSGGKYIIISLVSMYVN